MNCSVVTSCIGASASTGAGARSRWENVSDGVTPQFKALNMNSDQKIFIGTDSGATTSKIAPSGKTARPSAPNCSSTRPMRKTGARPSSAAGSRASRISGAEPLAWSQVHGVGLAIPGPYERYGVFGKSPNLPASFCGWDVHRGLQRGAGQTGRPPHAAGRGQRRQLRRRGRGAARARETKASVLMLMPGSGLGCAFVGADGLAARPATRSPAWKPATCPCRCTCSASPANRFLRLRPRLGLRGGLHDHFRPAASAGGKTEKIPPPRTRPIHRAGEGKGAVAPQPRAKGDALALEIFDFQARVMGLHVANLVMALDPGIVIIGGGLMDPEATTPEFRGALPAPHPRNGAALSLAAAARHHQNHPRRPGRIVAGHRRGARGAVSKP
jgi:glucokinase